jgi:hypothetical protein
MVSFLEQASEAYGFIISNCSNTLYYCPAVTQRSRLRILIKILKKKT